MKKIIAAGIVRTLRFDHENEADAYLKKLRWNKVRYRVNYYDQLPNGAMILNVTTGYNNNRLIERISQLGEEGNRNGNQK